MNKAGKHWRKVSQIYDRKADGYDRWFEKNPVFDNEVQALKCISSPLKAPALEIGIGTGRFAMQLGTDFGIDPALSPLMIARNRGAITCRAVGEFLPYIDNAFSTIFILFTECFLYSPEKVFLECHRVLNEKGRLVLGMVPAESRWGIMLRKRSRNGDLYYRYATLRKMGEVLKMLENCCYMVEETVATLFQAQLKEPPV